MKNCSLCNNEATDAMEVEYGNNAEYAICLNLCEAHSKESEETGYAFEEKYGRQIELLLSERFV